MAERRVLVVEDSFLILAALEMLLEQHGIDIVGPASTVAEALVLAETAAADIALLDVNLHGDMVFPVADLLIQRGIPIIFTTGYTAKEVLPPRFADIPTIQKPYEGTTLMALVEQALARAQQQTACSSLRLA